MPVSDSGMHVDGEVILRWEAWGAAGCRMRVTQYEAD